MDDIDIHVGVLLADRAEPRGHEADDYDEAGHALAWGSRGRQVAAPGRVAQLGQDVLRATASAVGREVALVVSGVIAGLDHSAVAGPDQGALDTGTYEIQDLELTFGVTAALGTGKAIEAFLSATGEATVEVRLTLRKAPEIAAP